MDESGQKIAVVKNPGISNNYGKFKKEYLNRNPLKGKYLFFGRLRECRGDTPTKKKRLLILRKI